MTKKKETLDEYIKERRKWLSDNCDFIADGTTGDLVNTQTMFDEYKNLYQTFIDKNHDYGNSFEGSLNEYGIVASLVRIGDKHNRLRTLTRMDTSGRVDESVIDTLLDMANYAVMTAVWLKGIEEERKWHEKYSK